MKPIKLLAETVSGNGELIELVSHDNDYQLRSAGATLFSSWAADADRALGEIATRPFLCCRNPRILLAGFGLGYTARAVLDTLEQRRGEVTVAEPLPDITSWHRSYLRGLHGDPPVITDSRLRVLPTTLEQAIWSGEERHAIVIRCLGSPAEEAACSVATVAAAHQCLRPGGMVCVLAPLRDKAFEKTLRQCGFEVAAKPLETSLKARRPKLASLWLARKQ